MMTNELFLNGELILSRKETHCKSKQTKPEPVFTSRMEKLEYYNNHFDLQNVLNIKGLLEDIKANWNTYVSQINQWIQKYPLKRLLVTGIFTVVLGLFTSTANAALIQEYTYQVQTGDKIENIAAVHGVTAQEILDANGLSSIEGKTILLPKVQDKTVTATILNIRSQPSTQSSIIGKYKTGDVVKAAFEENGWAGILINGRLCFVSTAYLKDSVPAVQNKNSDTSSSEYVIKKGDTFTKIGKSLGISAASIQALNPSVNPSKLAIGKKLKIPAAVQIKVTAQIAGVDPEGTFRFITADGVTNAAKASGNMINELFTLQGKTARLTLVGNRGQLMTLVSVENLDK